MKSLILNIFKSLGYNIIKIIDPPYAHLRDMPRYTETVVDLQGHKHVISDALSFFANYQEIYLDGMYEFNCKSEKPYILDCGSNYGTSIVYFKSRFPNAEIIGVEADPKIYAVCKNNIEQRNFSDVNVINKAISNSSEKIKFYCEGSDGGRSHPINEDTKVVEVEPIRLDDLISRPVDFLKLDIEGAEAETLCKANNLKDVTQMFIEYHSFKDTPQALGDILNKLREEGFRYYIHEGFCSKKPLVEEKIHFGMDMQLNIYAKKI